ncbi:tumor necrosis factor receptor superfamily member 9a [Diretmus argenteus]
MSVILLAILLLIQGCLSSAGETEKGCSKWSVKGKTEVCCDVCNPGFELKSSYVVVVRNHLVRRCGPNLNDLCTPCEPDTYTVDPTQYSCPSCTQCAGAQVLEKACTSTADTVCGCKDGLTCGNRDCSFCVQKCGKGEEPAELRTCRACPEGTFNDQIHQKCKPWRTRCPHGEDIMAKGSAVSDIMCSNNISETVIVSVAPVITEKKGDDPRTLIAVECSFHEAQQEQGSSSESLASKDSRNPLIV